MSAPTALDVSGIKNHSGAVRPVLELSVSDPARIPLSLSALVLRTETELQSLAREWSDLFHSAACENIFLSFDWMFNWWKHVASQPDLFVVVVRDHSSQVVGIAPLYIRHCAGILNVRRLGVLGDTVVCSDALDILATPEHSRAIVACVAEALREHMGDWHFAEFAATQRDSLLAALCEQWLLGRTRSEYSTSCPYVTLPPSADAYLATRSSGFQRKLRRYPRVLERQATLEHVVVRSGSDLELAFSDLQELHRRRFDAKEQESAFLDPHVSTFHAAVLKCFGAHGCAQLHLLKLNGRPVAAMYTLSTGKKLSLYQTGVDPDFGKFSVGVVLMHSIINNAIQDGYREFDLLRGAEAYKFQWATGVRELHTFRLFRGQLKSQLAYGTYIIRKQLQVIKHAFRQHNDVTAAVSQSIPEESATD
jgi:CelD/BcsL family acetyltransferase involved in cellulose biosynthesis